MLAQVLSEECASPRSNVTSRTKGCKWPIIPLMPLLRPRPQPVCRPSIDALKRTSMALPWCGTLSKGWGVLTMANVDQGSIVLAALCAGETVQDAALARLLCPECARRLGGALWTEIQSLVLVPLRFPAPHHAHFPRAVRARQRTVACGRDRIATTPLHLASASAVRILRISAQRWWAAEGVLPTFPARHALRPLDACGLARTAIRPLFRALGLVAQILPTSASHMGAGAGAAALCIPAVTRVLQRTGACGPGRIAIMRLPRAWASGAQIHPANATLESPLAATAIMSADMAADALSERALETLGAEDVSLCMTALGVCQTRVVCGTPTL
jgi:hypothetical protein